MKRVGILRISVFAGFMLLFWLSISGHYGLLLISFGVASSVFTALLSQRLGLLSRLTLYFHLRTLRYLPWLLKEIVKSNIDVARLILHPKMPIDPQMVWVPARQKTDLGVCVFANSITLTPGTLSVDLEGRDIEVHALTSAMAADVQASDMGERVSMLEDR